MRRLQDGEARDPHRHHGDVLAAQEDSAGFKDAIDESCWTPLDVDYPLRNEQFHVLFQP